MLKASRLGDSVVATSKPTDIQKVSLNPGEVMRSGVCLTAVVRGSGKRLCPEDTHAFDSTLDEGKGWLSPSSDKKLNEERKTSTAEGNEKKTTPV